MSGALFWFTFSGNQSIFLPQVDKTVGTWFSKGTQFPYMGTGENERMNKFDWLILLVSSAKVLLFKMLSVEAIFAHYVFMTDFYLYII